jgi:Tol biopolymer transport system component
MGEVYRATDTKLNRDVAIKVLPSELAEEPERLARFEREAKLLASLNHPNIAHVYGFESGTLSDGVTVHFLAMELVEGEELAERLKHGLIPVDEALEIAKQIAEALEEAHEHGIVHRDLKPANVKVTPDGKVKVLDFGLAKAYAGESATGSSADLSQSPTLAHTGTQAGVILGTAAYMSPEQARGKPVDKRADIWAFGVVLYEMLAGGQLFGGETVSDVLAAVLTREIDLQRLPASTRPAVRTLLRRCLERDPRQRLHDVADARIVLDELGAGRGEAEPAPAQSSGIPGFALAAGAVLLVAALAAGAWIGRRASAPAAAGAADAGLHRFTRLTFASGMESSPSLSPDGEFVAYTAIDGGDRDIFLLRVGGQRSINLTEDSAAAEDHPAFSPDGKQIAFRSERAGGGIFVMGATGESTRRLTKFGDNPSWSPDGSEIVFATEGESDPHAREKLSELWVVKAAGGEPHKIFAGDAVMPSWSPDGNRIAYWRIAQGTRDVWTIAADGSDPQPVTAASSVDWNPVWARDGAHLYFESDRGGVMNPWRVAIDEPSGRLRGEPEPITLPTSWSGQLSLSADERRLAYRTSDMTAEVRRIPIDAGAGRITGPAERLFETAIPAVGLDVSADGWMLFRTAAMQEDVYVMRVDGSGLRKLTDDEAKDRNPVWSPDGQQAAFYSNRSGFYEIWTVNRDGSGLRRRTATSSDKTARGTVLFPIWSPDGRSIALSADDEVVRFVLRDEPVPRAEMERIPVDVGDGKVVYPLSWSPDGRKIAGVRIGQNGQLLGGLVVHDLQAGATRFLRIDLPVPPAPHDYPILSWLPDSRRGVVRWGDRVLLVDTATEQITTLLAGFNRDGGIARVTGDGRWLYMLDSRDEGDLWMASQDLPASPAAGADQEAATGAPR